MLSTELLFLIECCKVSLLNASCQPLDQLIKDGNPDWKRIQKMAGYHGIRPFVYEGLKRVKKEELDADFYAYLNSFVKVKAIHNLLFKQEQQRLDTLFAQNAIQARAFKGTAWSNYLYPVSFRESVDIDYLLAEKDIFRALDVLMQDGYQIDATAEAIQQYKPQELLKALHDFGQIEVTMFKQTGLNFRIHLDFHWDLLIQAQTIGFKVEELFRNNFSEPEKVLLMILIHNGKRESWTKLKFILDFVVFVKYHGHEIEWDTFIEKIDAFALKKSLSKGLSLVNIFLPVKETISLSAPIDQPEPLNIDFWEKAELYQDSFKTRLSFIKLTVKYHKNLNETYHFVVNYIKYLSYPNPREERLYTFPKERTFLNLSSKVLSYFYFLLSPKK
jgi:hypothetical protein